MRSPDGGLRPILRQYLRRGWDWTSVETGGTGRGVADTSWATRPEDGTHAEGWIELKWTDGWQVTLRPEQVGWLTRRAIVGGRVHVAVRRRCEAGVRREAADELWLILGARAQDARDGGLDPAADYVIGRWTGGPARWGWAEIAGLLVSTGQQPRPTVLLEG